MQCVGKGVWANSIQCSDCCGWVHKRCSGARCPLVTIQSFKCRIFLTDEEVRCEGERMKNLNVENGEVLEGVRKFRYLGDVLNGEGGSRLASISRVRCGWKKFRELSGILTSKKVALRWMCGVSLREKTNAELRASMGIEKISDVLRYSRLRCMGHVLRNGGGGE